MGPVYDYNPIVHKLHLAEFERKYASLSRRHRPAAARPLSGQAGAAAIGGFVALGLARLIEAIRRPVRRYGSAR